MGPSAVPMPISNRHTKQRRIPSSSNLTVEMSTTFTNTQDNEPSPRSILRFNAQTLQSRESRSVIDVLSVPSPRNSSNPNLLGDPTTPESPQPNTNSLEEANRVVPMPRVPSIIISGPEELMKSKSDPFPSKKSPRTPTDDGRESSKSKSKSKSNNMNKERPSSTRSIKETWNRLSFVSSHPKRFFSLFLFFQLNCFHLQLPVFFLKGLRN